MKPILTYGLNASPMFANIPSTTLSASSIAIIAIPCTLPSSFADEANLFGIFLKKFTKLSII